MRMGIVGGGGSFRKEQRYYILKKIPIWGEGALDLAGLARVCWGLGPLGRTGTEITRGLGRVLIKDCAWIALTMKNPINVDIKSPA